MALGETAIEIKANKIRRLGIPVVRVGAAGDNKLLSHLLNYTKPNLSYENSTQSQSAKMKATHP